MRFAFIQAHARIWRITTMCRVLEVSRAGYYAWRARPLCDRVKSDRVLTAEILLAEPRMANTVVYTAGDTITYGRLADIVDSVLGRQVNRVEWNVPQLEDELAKESGNPIKKYRVVFAKGVGVAWDKDKTFNGRRGIEVQDVEQWARSNLT